MQKHYLTLDLKKEFSENTIWDNLLKTNLNNVVFWESEFLSFKLFLQSEMDKLLQCQTSWDKTYFPFKKIISAVQYVSAYLGQYSFINYNRKESISPMLDSLQETFNSFFAEIWSNEKVINKFKELKTSVTSQKQKGICDSWLLHFFLENKSVETKKNYQKITSRLQGHINDFIDNKKELYKKDSNSLYVSLSQAEFIKGIPKEIIASALINAKNVQKDGWLFYLDEYVVIKIIKESKNRAFREKAYKKFQQINKSGQFTLKNSNVLKNIISEKHKISQLMGKDNYAELVLSNYLLNTPKKALTYLDKIEKQLQPNAKQIECVITSLANEDNLKPQDIKAWDVLYYSQRMKDKYYPPNDTFRKYFSFEKVLPKLLKFFEAQFEISLEIENFNGINNKDVLFLKIKDHNTKRYGNIVLSPYTNNKQMCYQLDILKSDTIENGFIIPNIQFIDLQINKSKDGISQLSFYDMITLIHEFGHAFHSFFESIEDHIHKNLHLSWDLIELPSQFLEHLVYDYEFMKSLSSHENSGRKISYKAFLKTIQIEQCFESHSIYSSIQKFKSQLSLYENFQPYSLKNIQETIENQLALKGIIYNIADDEYMIYNDHSLDYGPAGYIYLYSAQLAYQLFQKKNLNLRTIFSTIFNSKKHKNLKLHMKEKFNLTEINILKFIQKDLPIDIH